jgi:archaellum component FlaC
MKFTKQALQASKKAKHNLNTIVIDYFNIIQKSDNKINDLEKEIKRLKYQVEFEKHTSKSYLQELKKYEKRGA